MAVLAFASVKASPGVTTTLLALAAVWPEERSLLLVDADPDGGDLAARIGLGVEPGMASLAAAGRRSLDRADIERHTQTIPGGVPVLLGNPDPEQAARELELVGQRLADVLPNESPDVLVDCGRLRSSSPAVPLAVRAFATLIVCRPRVDELQHVRAQVGRFTAQGMQPDVLLVGDRPYSAHEVETAIGCEVVDVIADDPTTAAALAGRGGRASVVSRSPLIRSARSLADRIVATADPKPAPPAPPAPPAAPREDVHGLQFAAVATDEDRRPVRSSWASRAAGNGRRS